MPSKSILIKRRDTVGGTLRVSAGNGWADHGVADYRYARIEFKGQRGARQHSLGLSEGEIKAFAYALQACAQLDESSRKAVIELINRLYFNIGKRIGLYLSNADELSAVLLMFAAEQDKVKK